MLRFAILKSVGEDENKVVIEYDEKQLLLRLQLRVNENLYLKEKFIKKSFNRKEIKEAIEDAFIGLISEFKQKTITLK